MRPLVAGHVQDVAEATGGDHADVSALALDHHIRCDRGAVEQEVQFARCHTGHLAHLEHAAHHRLALIGGRAGDFMNHDLLPAVRRGVLEYNVGKRSADVDAHTVHWLLLSSGGRRPFPTACGH